MIRDRMLRALRAAILCTFGVIVLSQPAMAAKSHGTMSPFLRLSSQESLSQTSAGASGPQYGLFGCQVGFSVGQCYDPYQMRRAYRVDSLIATGFDGRGHTIIIVDAFQSPNIVANLNFYNAFYGLPGLNGPGEGTFTQVAPQGLTPFDQNDGNMVGWAEEITLDVLWAHAIAPGANIVLLLATDNSDIALASALKYAVDNNLGEIVSMSFGENESCLDSATQEAWHNVFAAATMKNITLFASSADQGAALPTCDGESWVKAVSSPASDPLVTGVGGTELRAADYCLVSLGCDPTVNPPFGTYLSEIVWNEGPTGDFQAFFGATEATGGGFSVVFDEPPYQKGTIHGGKQRAVPDVGYNAAILHGVLTYLDIPGVPVGFYRFGGTSAGSPQWAAIAAIANQRAGKHLGFLNSAIYQIGKVNKASAASFHDITVGTNSALEFDSSDNPVSITGFDAGPGWDATTGNGTPFSSTSLVDNLIKYVSPGDGVAVLANTKPKKHAKPIVPGSMDPH